MTLKYGGNLGIGTTNPDTAYKSDVNGGIKCATGFTMKGTDTWASYLSILNDAGNGVGLVVGGSANTVLGAGNIGMVYIPTINNYGFSINYSSGNVFINNLSVNTINNARFANDVWHTSAVGVK